MELTEKPADGRTDGGISNPRSACILLNHGTAWACLQRRDRERGGGGERGREADEETRVGLTKSGGRGAEESVGKGDEKKIFGYTTNSQML